MTLVDKELYKLKYFMTWSCFSCYCNTKITFFLFSSFLLFCGTEHREANENAFATFDTLLLKNSFEIRKFSTTKNGNVCASKAYINRRELELWIWNRKLKQMYSGARIRITKAPFMI